MAVESAARAPLRRALVALCRLAETLAALCLFAVTTLIMIQVFARELFNDGAVWADELARWFGLGLIFLAVPLLLVNNGHVRVDMFLNLLPRLPRRAADIAIEILTLVFCALYLVSGWYFMQRAGRFSTPALSIPNLLYYMPAAVGMALMSLAAIDRVVLAITDRLDSGSSAGGHGA